MYSGVCDGQANAADSGNGRGGPAYYERPNFRLCIDKLMEENIEAGRRELLDDGGVVGVTIPRVFNGTVERVALEALFERNVGNGNVKSECMVLRERESVWSE